MSVIVVFLRPLGLRLNPSLAPNFRDDYPAIEEKDLDHDIPQFAYLELGDEMLNMYQTQQILERFMIVHTYTGGYHRLEYPDGTAGFTGSSGPGTLIRLRMSKAAWTGSEGGSGFSEK